MRSPWTATNSTRERMTSCASCTCSARRPRSRALLRARLYVEQPLPRSIALDVDLPPAVCVRPLLIDESDATLDAFPAARARGYVGVSSKSCKGVYKALLNAARCAQWNTTEAGGRYFVSGEDLTMQPGLGVQQDLALATLLGLRSRRAQWTSLRRWLWRWRRRRRRAATLRRCASFALRARRRRRTPAH